MTEGKAVATGCGAIIAAWAIWLAFICGLVWLLAHIVASAF